MTSAGTTGQGCMLQRGDGGIGASVAASKNWGTTTASIRVKAKTPGTAGNNRVVEVLVSGASFVTTSITANVLRITAPTTATVAMVVSYLYQNATFRQYWDADYNAVGDGTGTILAQSATVTAGGTDGGETFTDIPELRITSMPGIELSTVEATNLQSDGWREHKGTLKQLTSFTARVHWLPANAVHAALWADISNKLLTNLKLKLSDTPQSVLSFAAIVTGIKPGADMEEMLDADITFLPSGPATLA